MTVDEMLRRMSSREITEWMAFSELEPFGGIQEDGGCRIKQTEDEIKQELMKLTRGARR